MKTEWKQVARPGNQPFSWYLVYSYKMPAYDGSRKLFDKPVVEMLPYSESMLTRRLERGADVPDKWKAQVFEIGEAA